MAQNTQVTAAYSGGARVIDPPAHFKPTHVRSREEYDRMYRQSIEDPDGFWAEQAKRIHWFKPFNTVKQTSFKSGEVSIRWFDGGLTNASYNCLDRHLDTRGDQTALIFEPDEPTDDAEHITYRQLHKRVCRFANVLKEQGVKKGDRVTIYLPMIPEAAIAMLACARIGAVHSVVFGGFSADSLVDRITNCESTFVVTADEGRRAGRTVPLKTNADRAVERCPGVKKVLVVRNTGGDVEMTEGRDVWYHEVAEDVNDECEPEPMAAEDPLYILYTSGSTGKPKGVVHTTAGYLVFAGLTHEVIFDYRPGDVYWCTADVGWVTGHTYIVYGPLLNGATQVFFEGTPTYPDPSRIWQVVDRHEVNIVYTAPTAIRSLMRAGKEYVERTSRKSLRLLGSVGEPINPEAWMWYHDVVGEQRCPVVDTWWQTETGGIMISPIPGIIPQKPGSASLPFFGVRPQIVNAQGELLEGAGEGFLVIADSWPGQARTVYQNHERFEETYFSQVEGRYYTGDGCRRDEDGYYWITGRVDDVLNVSGHRIGTAEVESALVQHDAVVEAAVVGFPHDIKGQGIYAFVTLAGDVDGTDSLRAELVNHVRKVLGPIAKPDTIHLAEALPKTRSGKIMRRILRRIAANDLDNVGDVSTLADPAAVQSLINERRASSDS